MGIGIGTEAILICKCSLFVVCNKAANVRDSFNGDLAGLQRLAKG
jgi:hypothetical protein